MLAHCLQRLVMVAAAIVLPALLLLAPAVARAAILPACESHELSRTPAEWLAAMPTILPDSCTAGAIPNDQIRNDDELGDATVPAMCSEHGASVVAPGRVVPIVDARIDAAPGCELELGGPAVGTGHNDAPLGPPAFATLDHAVLGADVMVPPAASELAPPFVAVVGGARAGVKRGIEQPPK